MARDYALHERQFISDIQAYQLRQVGEMINSTVDFQRSAEQRGIYLIDCLVDAAS